MLRKSSVALLALVAALSAMNSQLYVTSRMMFSLSRGGYAPQAFGKLSRNGVPTRAIATQTLALGTESAKDVSNKLDKHQVKTFQASECEAPLVEGCAGWLVCKLIPETHNQATYDLFIGEVIAAYADERVFSAGRWHFDGQPDALRTLHYVAGGQFYVTGESLQVTA